VDPDSATVALHHCTDFPKEESKETKQEKEEKQEKIGKKSQISNQCSY